MGEGTAEKLISSNFIPDIFGLVKSIQHLREKGNAFEGLCRKRIQPQQHSVCRAQGSSSTDTEISADCAVINKCDRLALNKISHGNIFSGPSKRERKKIKTISVLEDLEKDF